MYNIYCMSNYKIIQLKNCNLLLDYLLLQHNKSPFLHDLNNFSCHLQLEQKKHILKTENVPFTLDLPSAPSL